MKPITLFLLLLLATTVNADTNYVRYVKATGEIRPGSYDTTWSLTKDQVSRDGQSFRELPDFTVDKGVGITALNPAGKTNIVQLADFTVIIPSDYVTDFEKTFDPKLKAVVTGLVKAINSHLAAGNKITAAEIKTAIREELAK